MLAPACSALVLSCVCKDICCCSWLELEEVFLTGVHIIVIVSWTDIKHYLWNTDLIVFSILLGQFLVLQSGTRSRIYHFSPVFLCKINSLTIFCKILLYVCKDIYCCSWLELEEVFLTGVHIIVIVSWTDIKHYLWNTDLIVFSILLGQFMVLQSGTRSRIYHSSPVFLCKINSLTIFCKILLYVRKDICCCSWLELVEVFLTGVHIIVIVSWTDIKHYLWNTDLIVFSILLGQFMVLQSGTRSRIYHSSPVFLCKINSLTIFCQNLLYVRKDIYIVAPG